MPVHRVLFTALGREVPLAVRRLAWLPRAMIPLTNAHDPESFRRDGHRIVDRLADYLRRAASGSLPVLPAASPDDARANFPADLGATPREDLDALAERVIESAQHLHHPRYVGHQVTPPLPRAALFELVSALLNNSMAVFEMGPGGTAMEDAVIRTFARALGFGDGARGVLTSGGSIGNLTALLAARRAKAPPDVWAEGLAGTPPLAVLASRDAHYSIARAAAIAGLGEQAIVPVAIDPRRRMRPDALGDAFDRARHAGRTPIAVVASAGATPTGSFDPLVPIAEFCAARGLWLHVDGAHGASAALSPRHRHLLEGIERADSVVWDAHKMMMMPALVTAVLFREGRSSYEAFAQDASYLFHGADAEEPWFDVGRRTLECTKRMLSLPLYACLRTLGTAPFAEYVERTFALGRRLYERLAEAPDFEAPVEPEANIVCFRYMSSTLTHMADVDALQERIRKRVVASGRYYFVQTRLDDRLYLRTTLMNPATTDDDLAGLLGAIREAAAQGA
jgi:L-2,4-diaminobutyrate decarboxylase